MTSYEFSVVVALSAIAVCVAVDTAIRLRMLWRDYCLEFERDLRYAAQNEAQRLRGLDAQAYDVAGRFRDVLNAGFRDGGLAGGFVREPGGPDDAIRDLRAIEGAMRKRIRELHSDRRLQ